MSNVARDIMWPTDNNILVRVVFLYVGQGESTIVIAADNETYHTLLVDINLDEKNGGIDVPRLMADLLEDEDSQLGVFVNTHPHNDHLSGIVELSEAVDIREVWHSGHVPGKEHKDAYDKLQEVIRKVKQNSGAEEELCGSRSSENLGEAEYHALAPAEYVVDEIGDESAEERYRRIHEQCTVLKFGTGSTWVMLTGDADRDAWEKHITNYHSERLEAVVLSAAHHGSRTFFCYEEGDEPYLDALRKIKPDYVVISAPKRDESQWGHPHEDAVKHYSDQVGEDNTLHTGDKRHCFICDIFRDGQFAIWPDNGDLVDAYGIDGGDDSDNGHGEDNGSRSKTKGVVEGPFIGTRVDRRPMGDH